MISNFLISDFQCILKVLYIRIRLIHYNKNIFFQWRENNLLTWNIYLTDVSICLHLLFFSFVFIYFYIYIYINIYTRDSFRTYSSKFSWREILYRFRIDIVNIDLRWTFISWSVQHHSHLFSRNIPPLLNSNLVSPKVPISLQPEHMTNWWLSQAVFDPEPRKEIVSLKK